MQRELDRVIKVMKSQHQYINNLQQANLTLKGKVKMLEELKCKQEFAQQEANASSFGARPKDTDPTLSEVREDGESPPMA